MLLSNPPTNRFWFSLSAIVAFCVAAGFTPLQAQYSLDSDGQFSREVRPVSYLLDPGVVAARLEAGRAMQIRVTVQLLMVDDVTRANIYQAIADDGVKTVSNPRAPTEYAELSAGEVSQTETIQTIYRNSPISTCVIDETRFENIMSMIADSPDSNADRTRSIILLDGRDADYTDITQRPFVTGIERLESGVLNPIVTVLDEGSKIRVNASLADPAPTAPLRIRLKSEISWHKILDVRSETLYGFDRQSPTVQPPTVQVPTHVTKTTLASEELSEGQALLVDPYITQSVQHQRESAVPVLRKLPYLGRSFKKVEEAAVDRNIMVLLRPAVATVSGPSDKTDIDR